MMIDDTLTEAMDRYADGGLDADGFTDLCNHIRNDPQAAREMATRSMLNHEIRRQLLRRSRSGLLDSATAAAAPPVAYPAARSRRRVTPAAWRQSLAAAAVVLIALLGSWAMWSMNHHAAAPNHHPAVAAAPAAVLVESHNAEFAGDPLTAGQELAPGLIDLRSGSARFTLLDGTTLELVAPSQITLIDRNRVALHRGRLSAAATPGFTIDGPGGVAVTDLGTQFNMEVDDAGRSHVYVVQGSVRVSFAEQGRISQRVVYADMGVVADPAARTLTAVDTPSDPWLAAAPLQPVITILSDDADGSIFHTLDHRTGVFNQTDLIVGSAAGPGNYNGIAFFRLPDRRGGRIAEASLSLSVQIAGKLSKANIDVWALGYMNTPPNADPHWLLNADTDDRTGAVLGTHLGSDHPVKIADNAVPAGSFRNVGETWHTDAAQTRTLTDFINALYDAHGARPGDWLVIRINPDADVASTYHGPSPAEYQSVRFGGSQRTSPDHRAKLTLHIVPAESTSTHAKDSAP